MLNNLSILQNIIDRREILSRNITCNRNRSTVYQSTKTNLFSIILFETRNNEMSYLKIVGPIPRKKVKWTLVLYANQLRTGDCLTWRLHQYHELTQFRSQNGHVNYRFANHKKKRDANKKLETLSFYVPPSMEGKLS